jgi:hypothetical protein
MFSVFIDTILVTADLHGMPGEASVWRSVYSLEENDNSVSQFTLRESLAPGRYRWSVRVFDGDRLIDSEGEQGIPMPFANFTILP